MMRETRFVKYAQNTQKKDYKEAPKITFDTFAAGTGT
jgi:hypothetical protein